jgi:diphosphomevalonate decarboxylase
VSAPADPPASSLNEETVCRAGPSLALIKYWGKEVKGDNLPATPSLAVTLGGVYTETRATAVPGVPASAEAQDVMRVDGVLQDPARYTMFFDTLRHTLGIALRFRASSRNSFPTSAGLASSSSGFAALAGACARAAGCEPSATDLSAIARAGSASAARSVYGGFVLLPAGARRARQLYGPEHWPELRIVVAVTHRSAKPVPSRRAMEETRASSPYYFSWIKESAELLPEALRAVEARDLELLGETARRSYSLMHGAILGAEPPLLYWLPGTVAVIHACAVMRAAGIGAWETIDAGPQVKILCLLKDVPAIVARVGSLGSGIQTILCHPGPGLQYGPLSE